ncbi:MAG: NAD(+) synthase [Bacteroidia bacterium]
MKHLKIAGAALNQTALAFPENTANIIRAVEAAKAQGVSILCLPELAIPGYGCEDAFFADWVVERSLKSLQEIAEASEGIAVSVGLPMVVEGCVYNTTAFIWDQEIVGFVAKQELAGDGIYYEPRWFKRWEGGAVTLFTLNGHQYPFGDLIFELDGVRIGFEICEDAWNGDRPAQDHYRHNVDVILNPSASNFAFGKSEVREMLVREASRAFTCTYVYSNLLGNDAGRIIFDGEILIAQSGKLMARNQRFGFEDYQILPAVVDVEAPRLQKKKSFNFEPELPDILIEIDGHLPEAKPGDHPTLIAPDESKDEEFLLAETLALWDYMRKSRSRGFILSLSGGADSSCCAVLVGKMFERAKEALGEALFAKKLSYARIDPEKPLISQLFTCVYQGTENSGDATLESAQALAEGLGATFHNWNVEPLRQQYHGLAEQALGRALSWETDDIAMQNIQARLRAPGVWMLANLQGALLLTTSNRSEAAVGYATMDGDTAGGLAPLGGIDKESLIKWLHWAEDALDVPSLRYVNSLKPMAELRPGDAGQTDEGDLMPYPMLERIEELAIGQYLAPEEVFRALQGVADDDLLKAWITKFFRLWSRNQWKRERYAPSFHLDDKNLDPKTWCRFPILNGGFREQLEELD